MGQKPASLVVAWPPSTENDYYNSATEFLIRIAQKQWSKTSHQEMKNQLSKRALTMTGKFIHPFQGDEPFVRELGRVGFLRTEFRRAD